MSVSISMSSPDLDKQIALLEFYPEIVQKNFKPALRASVSLLDAAIRPAIPVGENSPHAKDLFRSTVTGTTVSNMIGRAGWSAAKYPWYINVVEYGSRAHDLGAGANTRTKRGRSWFDWASSSGVYKSLGGTHIKVKGAGWKTVKFHPGFAAVGFLQNGFRAALPAIESLMAAANEACIQDLKVN